jgi:hypothetical protein
MTAPYARAWRQSRRKAVAVRVFTAAATAAGPRRAWLPGSAAVVMAFMRRGRDFTWRSSDAVPCARWRMVTREETRSSGCLPFLMAVRRERDLANLQGHWRSWKLENLMLASASGLLTGLPQLQLHCYRCTRTKGLSQKHKI